MERASLYYDVRAPLRGQSPSEISGLRHTATTISRLLILKALTIAHSGVSSLSIERRYQQPITVALGLRCSLGLIPLGSAPLSIRITQSKRVFSTMTIGKQITRVIYSLIGLGLHPITSTKVLQTSSVTSIGQHL